MNLKDIILPWLSLIEERRDAKSLLNYSVDQRKKIMEMEDEMRIMKLRTTFLKDEIKRLKGLQKTPQKRLPNGRFAPKKST
jgi:hypothetical protein